MHIRALSTIAATLTALASAACGPSQVTPLGPIPPGVQLDLQERPYAVAGASVDELRSQMEALGPGSAWFRYHWRIRWGYRYGPIEAASVNPGSSSETQCGTSNIEVTLVYTTDLPRWEPPADASPELKAQWDTFITAVKRHGEGHRDIAIPAAREIVDRLKRLETPNCAFMEREARALVKSILDRRNAENAEYEQASREDPERRVRWPPPMTEAGG